MTEDSNTGSEDETDWAMAPDSDAEFEPDPERVAVLRDVAEDLRDRSSEGDQVAAILQRVSDLYDPEEDTSPEEIYLNMRNVLNVMEGGGIDR